MSIKLSDIAVGDTITDRILSMPCIVRYIGVLEGIGLEDSIWCDVDCDFNGWIKPYTKGGTLTYSYLKNITNVERGNKDFRKVGKKSKEVGKMEDSKRKVEVREVLLKVFDKTVDAVLVAEEMPDVRAFVMRLLIADKKNEILAEAIRRAEDKKKLS